MKFIIIVSFFIVASQINNVPGLVVIKPPLPNCSVKCMYTGQPLCAILDGNYQLFANECGLSAHYCDTGEQYEVIEMSLCKRYICPIPCSNDDKQIVCAKAENEKKTFNSTCSFLNHACANPDEDWYRELNDDCEKLPLKTQT